MLIVVLGSPDAAAATETAAAEPPPAPAPPEAAAVNAPAADSPIVESPVIAAMPVYSDEDAATDEMVGNLLESEWAPHEETAALPSTN